METSESNSIQAKSICPFLGLADDRASRFSYPEVAHRCFAAGHPTSVSTEHQSAFCFAQRYPACPRFVELPVEAISIQPSPTPAATSNRKNSSFQTGPTY